MAVAAGNVAVADGCRHRLIGDQCRQPVFVRNTGPAAGGRRIISGIIRLVLGVGAHFGIAEFLQSVVRYTEQALEQQVITGGRRRVVAPHALPREKFDRQPGRVLHLLVNREHVMVVDAEANVKSKTLAVAPGQGDRLSRREFRRRGGPHRVVSRQFDLLAFGGRPAKLNVIGLRIGHRLQQAHIGRVGRLRLAVVVQEQIVEAGAEQADRTAHGGGIDFQPGSLFERRRWGCRRCGGSCSWSTDGRGRFCRKLGLLSGGRRRVWQVARDNELPPEQDRDGDKYREEKVLLVH